MKTPDERRRDALFAITCLLDATRGSLHRRAAKEEWMCPAQLDASRAGTLAGIASSLLTEALDRPPAATVETLTPPVLPAEDPKLLLREAAERARELRIALPALPALLDGVDELIGHLHAAEDVHGHD